MSNTETVQNLQQRVDALEIQLSYMDDTVDQLNTVITRQTLELAQLQQQLKVMAKKLGGLADNAETVAPFVPDQNIPPHH